MEGMYVRVQILATGTGNHENNNKFEKLDISVFYLGCFLAAAQTKIIKFKNCCETLKMIVFHLGRFTAAAPQRKIEKC
jgi:hypothetical protein